VRRAPGPVSLALAVASLLLATPLARQARKTAPVAAPAPRISFTDVTTAAGLTFVHQSGATPEKRMFETFGSGVAWIDYDNDGYPDLYFVNGAPGSANALYHNNRDGTFTDVTARAGVAADADRTRYKTGVAVGDYDNDGYLDLYVAALGPNTLFHNNGDGTFTDVTAKAGVAGGAREWSTSAGFFDADNDGDLDLFVVNYLTYDPAIDPYCGQRQNGYRTYCHPTLFDGQASRFFRNNGDGTFTDVSREAGIANPAGKGLGITVCDYDRDGRTDVYIANDTVRNFLFHNNGNGTFTDVTYGAGVGFDVNGKPQAGMGVDCGDVDGNGYPDLFVTNFSEELDTLYLNRGGGVFDDATVQAGLSSSFLPLGFGAKFFDADNDGDLDIYVTNGHVIDNISLYQPKLTYEQKDLLYENLGGGRFRDISAEAGPPLQALRVGRGLAVADYDNDGRLDVVITSVGGKAVLLRNTSASARHWITIRAQGTRSNRFGLGAAVDVQAAGVTQHREINNVASYLSANDVRLHVGVGSATIIPRIAIRWPSGARQTLTNVAADQILAVREQ
jgi:hypothetical protein